MRTYIRISTWSLYIHTYIHIYTHTYVYTHIHTCIHIFNLNTQVHTYKHAYTHTCMYTHVHTYKHKNTHTSATLAVRPTTEASFSDKLMLVLVGHFCLIIGLFWHLRIPQLLWRCGLRQRLHFQTDWWHILNRIQALTLSSPCLHVYDVT